MFPDKEFLFKSMTLANVSLPKLDGIVPTSLFTCAAKCQRTLMLPIELGITPVIRFLKILNVIKFVKEPTDVGMLPLILFTFN